MILPPTFIPSSPLVSFGGACEQALIKATVGVASVKFWDLVLHLQEGGGGAPQVRCVCAACVHAYCRAHAADLWYGAYCGTPVTTKEGRGLRRGICGLSEASAEGRGQPGPNLNPFQPRGVVPVLSSVAHPCIKGTSSRAVPQANQCQALQLGGGGIAVPQAWKNCGKFLFGPQSLCQP